MEYWSDGRPVGGMVGLIPFLEQLNSKLNFGHDGVWPSRRIRKCVEGRAPSRPLRFWFGPALQHSATPTLQSSCSSSASGFTLIEVVIAFAVAALIIAAVASGLVATLRAEATAHRQATAETALRTLQTEVWLGTATNNLATNMPPGWMLESETVEQGEGTNRIIWTHWRSGPEARRSFVVSLFVQQP